MKNKMWLLRVVPKSGILIIAFLLASLVFSFIPALPMESFTTPSGAIVIGLLTDTHVGNTGDPQLPIAVANLNSYVPDVTILLGDAISGGSTEAYFDLQWSKLTDNMTNLTMPYYYARGNHESVSGWTDAQNIAKWITKSGMPNNYYSFDVSGYHIAVIDLITYNAAEGTWLTNDLVASNLPTIILSHYSVVAYPGIGWMGGVAAVQTILEADGDVVAVFNGHLHENAQRTVNGINYYGLSNTYTDAAIDIVTVYPNGSLEIHGTGINKSYATSTGSYLKSYFEYEKQVSINATSIGENLTNYPLCVSLNSTSLDFSHVQTDGRDIRFVDSTGVRLDYETEYWNSVTQKAVIWVKKPSITAGSTNGYILMEYGASDVGNAENKKDVWGTQIVLNTFNDTTDITGTLVSSNATGKIGVYYIVDQVSVPVAGVSYNTTYNPAGSWDFSQSGTELINWFSCNRASASFTSSKIYIYDTSGNYRWWDITFGASTWTTMVKSLSSGNSSATAPDLSQIDYIQWSFIAADTTPFYKAIDLTYTYAGYNTVLHFAEMTGTKTYNSTILGDYDTGGSLIGGITWNDYNMNFGGVNGYVRFEDGDKYDYTENYTIDAIINADTIVGVDPIVDKESGLFANVTYRFHLNAGVSRNLIHDGVTNSSAQAASAVTTGVTTYVTTTFNLVNLIAYKNATAGASTARTAVAPMNTNYFFVGTDQSGDYYDGIIDEVRLINLARSVEWIKADNLNTLGGFISFGIETHSPIIITLSAVSISMDKDGVTSGSFSGNLTDLGGTPTVDGWFEYGLTIVYGSYTANVTYNSIGVKNVSIPATLTPAQTYHYRFCGTNVDGTTYGADQSFTFTTPSVTTNGDIVNGSSITLLGSITNMAVASNTYVYFRYGNTPSYGYTTTPQILSGVANFSATISPPSGSEANLYYQAVTQNGAVVSYGVVHSTTTPSSVGGVILKSLLRLLLASVILIGVICTGSNGNFLVPAVIGLLAFGIIDVFISMI